MTTSTSPSIRVDGEIHASAKLVAPVMSRSAAQQISHWARIGRELESAQGVSASDIANVLVGRRSYDTLGDEEQAVVRAEWAERLVALRASVDLQDEFAAEGRTSWVGLDDQGNLVERFASGETKHL